MIAAEIETFSSLIFLTFCLLQVPTTAWSSVARRHNVFLVSKYTTRHRIAEPQTKLRVLEMEYEGDFIPLYQSEDCKYSECLTFYYNLDWDTHGMNEQTLGREKQGQMLPRLKIRLKSNEILQYVFNGLSINRPSPQRLRSARRG